MTRRVVVLAPADRDLEKHASYLAQRSLSAAQRFYQAAQAAFEFLSQMPEAGGVYEFRRQQLTGIRAWPIRGFENYVIFYRLVVDDVVILRVLHGARDADRIFEHEEGE